MIDYVKEFEAQKEENIRKMNQDPEIAKLRQDAYRPLSKYYYAYSFTWMERPILQMPEDILCMQEAIMRVRPDLIIETGVAHGGSSVFFASMLELLGDIPQDAANNTLNEASDDTPKIKREVIAIEIELRDHNREALDNHPQRGRINILEGSSTDPKIIQQVHEIASRHNVIMVILDSMHTHEHVYKELQAYAPLVTKGSYAVVCDTIVEYISELEHLPQRPWGKGNNPYTAAKQWLGENDNFICDRSYDQKALHTSNPEGWLLRIR